MSKVFRRLLAAYRRHDYAVRTGLNPYYLADPDEGLTLLYRHGHPLLTGRGLAPLEIMFLEELLAAMRRVEHILIIGNAFGWSTLAVAMACPDAKVVAIDAALEGSDSRDGLALTTRIAVEEGLNVTVVDALSPRDVGTVVNEHLNGRVDFALIDGLHVNEQLVRDVDAIMPFCHKGSAYFLHDVLNWHMLGAMRQIEGRPKVCTSRILTRLTSGPAVVFLDEPPHEVADLVDAYVDETFDPLAMIEACGGGLERAGPGMWPRLARGYRWGRTDLASVYLAEGRLDECVALLRDVVAETPDDAKAAFRAGACLLDAGHSEAAWPFFEAAAECEPEWADPPHQLGRIELLRQAIEPARAAFGRASELAPNWAPPRFELALINRRGGALEQAYRELHSVLELDPEWLPPHLELAHLAFELGRTEEASRYYQLALRLQPESVDALAGYVYLLAGLNNFDAALELCVELQQRLPGVRLQVWDSLEACLARLKNIGPAVSNLREVCERLPSLKAPWKLYGVALRRSGDLEGSRSALLQALVLVPDWPSVLYELGLTCRAMDRIEESRSYFVRAKALRPSLPGLDACLTELKN